jgi:hypothetical protein
LTNNASALLSLSASTGDIDLGLSSQSMNTFFAAPNGSAGEPSFRSILAADLPAPGGDVSGTYASMSVTKVNGSNWPSNTTGFLKNDGSGGLTWEAAGGGTVTSVGADAPLSSTGGNDPVISIPQATAGSDGYLSATDWSTFDAKQDALTTGNLSSSTTALVVTNGAGAVIGSGTSLSIADAAADGSTKGIASFAAADFNSTSGNISIDYTNGQAASGSTKGFLTSADWTTFNSKQNALTTGNLTSSDITVTGGTGAVIGSGTTLTIASNAVTNAKFRQSAAMTVVGRSANSTGDVADIATSADGDVLRRSGTTLGFGQIATAGITDNAVTFAKMVNSAAAGLSVVGRSTNSAGNFAEINAGSDGQVLRRSGTTLGFGTIATAGIGDAQVTFAKIQDVTNNRLLGRSSGAAGPPMEISIGSGLSLSGGTLSATGGSSDEVILVKTSSTSRTNTNTLAADPDLSGFSIGAGEQWEVNGYIRASVGNSGTPDFKWRFAASGNTIYYMLFQDHFGDATNADVSYYNANTTNTSTWTIDFASNQGQNIQIHGFITNNAGTARTIDLEWAQNTSNGTSTTVGASSMLRFKKIR